MAIIGTHCSIELSIIMTKLTTHQLNSINADVLLIFGKLQPETPKEYYHVKLNTYQQRHLPGSAAVPESAVGEPATLKLATQENLPAIPAELQKNINCLRGILNHDFPLLPPEVVDEDFVSVLLEDFNGIPANTVVLRRTTNLAVQYYVLLNIAVDADYNPILQSIETSLRTPQPVSAGHAQLLRGLGKESVGAFIAKGIAGGLLSAIGGAIANAVIDAIFPPQIPAYFDEVYQQIAKIVHQEIEQSKIDSISGSITNVVKAINNVYYPALSERDLSKKIDRDYMYQLLRGYENTFINGTDGMLGFLQLKEHANAGFTVFLLGASLQLAIYQELANVDPMNGSDDKGWRSPLESSYGKPKTGTVAKTATGYITFAQETYKNILKAREESITAEKYSELVPENKQFSKFITWKRVYYVRINDNGVATTVIKEIGQDNKDGKNPIYDTFVAKDLVNYRQTKVNELIKDMNNPLDVIADWQQLVETPIKVKQ